MNKCTKTQISPSPYLLRALKVDDCGREEADGISLKLAERREDNGEAIQSNIFLGWKKIQPPQKKRNLLRVCVCSSCSYTKRTFSIPVESQDESSQMLTSE